MLHLHLATCPSQDLTQAAAPATSAISRAGTRGNNSSSTSSLQGRSSPADAELGGSSSPYDSDNPRTATASATATSAPGSSAAASSTPEVSRWAAYSFVAPGGASGSGSAGGTSGANCSGSSSGGSASVQTSSPPSSSTTTTTAADIDVDAIHALYRAILALKHQPLLDAVAVSTDHMLGVIGRTACAGGQSASDLESRDASCPGLCRQLAIVFANPMLEEPEYHS